MNKLEAINFFSRCFELDHVKLWWFQNIYRASSYVNMQFAIYILNKKPCMTEFFCSWSITPRTELLLNFQNRSATNSHSD